MGRLRWPSARRRTPASSHGLPERSALALVEAAFGPRVRNASYRASADISNNLASRDLKALVDSGLLVPEGERRGRGYRAPRTPRVAAAVRPVAD